MQEHIVRPQNLSPSLKALTSLTTKNTETQSECRTQAINGNTYILNSQEYNQDMKLQELLTESTHTLSSKGYSMSAIQFRHET
jgi:hypothetical protein